MFATLFQVVNKIPANADPLASPTSGLIVSAAEKEAVITYSLPDSISLGDNDHVIWSLPTAVTFDQYGNRSFNLGFDSYGDCPMYSVLRCRLSGVGRTASLRLTSEFAITYLITVKATINENSYENTQSVEFLANAQRPKMIYVSERQAPTLTYISPDVGSDLQTIVKVRIDWSENFSDSGLKGPAWTSMWLVDSTGALERDTYHLIAPAQGGTCSVYFQNYELQLRSSNGCDTINIPVNYSNYRKWRGLHVLVAWSNISGGSTSAKFYRIYNIPINFPPPVPKISASCSDVFRETTSKCLISLIYIGALGEVTDGVPRDVEWVVTSSGQKISNGNSTLSAGSTLEVALPESHFAHSIEARILGESTWIQADAKPHDYLADLLRDLRLSQSCPDSFRSTTVTCKYSMRAESILSPTFKLNIQQRVDGKPWQTVKVTSMKLNSTISVRLTAHHKKSLDVRGIVTFEGKTFKSEIQEWETKRPQSGNPNSRNYTRFYSLMQRLWSSNKSAFSPTNVSRYGGVSGFCSNFVDASYLDFGISLSSQDKLDFILACKDFLRTRI